MRRSRRRAASCGCGRETLRGNEWDLVVPGNFKACHARQPSGRAPTHRESRSVAASPRPPLEPPEGRPAPPGKDPPKPGPRASSIRFLSAANAAFHSASNSLLVFATSSALGAHERTMPKHLRRRVRQLWYCLHNIADRTQMSCASLSRKSNIGMASSQRLAAFFEASTHISGARVPPSNAFWRSSCARRKSSVRRLYLLSFPLNVMTRVPMSRPMISIGSCSSTVMSCGNCQKGEAALRAATARSARFLLAGISFI